MASLNQIAEQVAIPIGKQYDQPILTLIKDLIKQERATRLRQSIGKYGLDVGWSNRYTVELELADIADTCEVTVGCNILRTVNKIPRPVRYTTDVPFIYVGFVDGSQSFSYVPFYQRRHKGSKRYTKKSITYDYRNGYVYVYDAYLNKLGYLAIDAIHENPDLVPYCNDGDGICYSDDMEFPCPADMIQSIKLSLLTGELRKRIIEDSEVKQENEPQVTTIK